MAVEIGTASNARDLVSKLEKFLTTNPELVQANQAWEVIKDSDGGDELAFVRVNWPDRQRDDPLWGFRRRFVGRGLDGEDTVVVPMALCVNDYYSISSLCAWYATKDEIGEEIAGYFVTTGGNRRDRNEPMATSIPLRNDEMPYWFVANGRRFIIVVKVHDVYMSMYCGFMLQFGTDLENPYPMYIGGSHNNTFSRILTEAEKATAKDISDWHGGSTRESHIDMNYGGFYDPRAYHNTVGLLHGLDDCSSCMCGTPNGVVAMVSGNGESLASSLDNKKYTSGYLLLYRYSTTVSGQHVVFPIEITAIRDLDATVNTATNYWREASTIGWLQGAYFVSGSNNTPEKELIIGDKRYLCFPPMKNDHKRWLALLME